MSHVNLHPQYERIQKLREEAHHILQQFPEKKVQAFTGNLEALLEELSVFQIELEMQNDELRDLQTKLEDSQKTNQLFVQLAPVGLCFLTPRGFIIEANPTAIRLLNLTPLAAKSHGDFSMSPLVHASDVGRFLESLSNCGSTPEGEIFKIKTKNGQHEPFLCHLVKISAPGQDIDEQIMISIAKFPTDSGSAKEDQ